MKKPQVVFRIAKLKTYGNIGGAAAHNLRTRPTFNADPKRKNIVLKGSVNSGEQVVQDVKDKLQHLKIRSNAVLAVEVLISASPEYFRPENPGAAGTWDEKKLNEWRKSVEPFIKKEFPHAVSVVLHLDESTPHYQIIDVPLNDKTGKLDARTKYGGRTILGRWQTKAHLPVKHLGIERGVQGSNAKHTTLKRWYALLRSEYLQDLPAVSPAPDLLPPRSFLEKSPLTEVGKERRKKEAEQKAKIAKRTAELKAQRRAKLKNYAPMSAKLALTELYIEKNKDLEARNEYLSKINKELEEENKRLAAIAKRLRPLDPELVLERLYNAQKTPEGHYRVKGHVVRVEAAATTTGAGTTHWVIDAQNKGRGAIDLVIKLSQCDYKAATLLLAQYFDAGEVVADSAAERLAIFEANLKQAISEADQQQQAQQEQQAQQKLKRIVTQAPTPRQRG